MPKYIPLANVGSNFFTFLISLLVLVAMMAYYMIFTDTPLHITPYILLSVVPILVLLLLSIGVGLILSVLTVFFKDVEYLYEVFCLLLFYMTPIIYKLDQLDLQRLGEFGAQKPIRCIPSCRCSAAACSSAKCGIGTGFIIPSVFSLLTVAVGMALFYKKQDKFILYL